MGCSRAMCWLAGAAVLLVAVAIFVEVVLRATINTSILGLDEVCGFVLAVASAWGFAHALAVKAHVRIDTLYLVLPLRSRPWLDLAALLTLGGFSAALLYRASELLFLSVTFEARSMSPLQIPLWIPQSLWVLGLLVFFAMVLLLTIKLLALLVSGQSDQITQLVGMDVIEAELASEIEDVARRRGSPGN
jgi:TRAP-type C4-dicarboxylate transport system permease small subunit